MNLILPPQLIEGELYAGIAFRESTPYCHLWMLPDMAAPDTWQRVLDWAKGLHPKMETEVPDRFESALLYANLRDHVDQDYWHWTATPYAGDESYAWCQIFDTGGHYYGLKDGLNRARAVRRVPIGD